jgi:hypothetical protein
VVDEPATDRDPDLVTLEALESELGEIDAELARVERSDEPVADAAPRTGPPGDDR